MESKRIIRFCAIAFGFTWLVAGIGWSMGITTEALVPYMVVAALCMLGPAIAAIILQRKVDGLPWSGLGFVIKGTQWRVLLLTAAMGMLLVPLYLLIQHVLGDRLGIAAFGHAAVSDERLTIAISDLMAQFGKDEPVAESSLRGMPAWALLLIIQVAALFSAFSLNLIFMLGEELGWRGYLYQVTEHWSGIRRIALTGVLWGLWHAPLIAMGHNYPGYPVVGIGMMVIFCMLAGFLFDWTRARSGSIWSSAMLHGLINGTAIGSSLFGWGGHPLVGSIVGVGGFITMAVFIVAIVAMDRDYRAMLSGAQPSA